MMRLALPVATLCVLGGLALANLAQAEVFTYLDAEGNRVFTDQPQSKNAKPVKLAPSNSMPSHAAPPPTPRSSTEPPSPMARYRLLRILLPEPDATLRDDDSLIVTLTSDPPLRNGHSYRLVFDGNAGDLSRSPVFAVHGIERGTHQLAAEIVDSQGRILERTPAQPFHLHLMSLAQKRQARPCTLDDYGVRPECPLADKPAPPRRFLGILP